MNDEPINLTKPFQFNDSEPINLTLLPEPESHEPMETAPAIEKNATRNNWWENELSVLCCNCSAKNILTPNENGFTCWNCCEKCIVARPCCCREENPETYFTVSAVSTKTICPLCKTNMNYLTCCKEFVAVSVKNDIINCVKCNKLFIECQCKFLNALPSKGLAFSCKNANCKYKTVNCDCGRKSIQLFEGVTPYLCECGCEFEYDIEVGVRKNY